MKNIYLPLVVGVACCVGCRTSQVSQSQRLQSVVAEVLVEHHFAPHHSLWHKRYPVAVAARPHSESAVEVSQVEMRPDGRVTVEILSYQYVGSNWAILGRLFTHDHPEQEALVMQSAIRDRLLRKR